MSRPLVLTSRTGPLERFRFAWRDDAANGFTALTPALRPLDQKIPARWLDRPVSSSTASPWAGEAKERPARPPTQPLATSGATTAVAGTTAVAAAARAVASRSRLSLHGTSNSASGGSSSSVYSSAAVTSVASSACAAQQFMHAIEPVKLHPKMQQRRCGFPTIVTTMYKRVAATRSLQTDGVE